MKRTRQCAVSAIVIISAAFGLIGCIDTTQGPSVYLSVTVTNANTSLVVRKLIEKFASANGYPKHVDFGPPILAKTGQFVDGFFSLVNDNYISSSNMKDRQCTGIAIYDIAGVSKATGVRTALGRYLRDNLRGQITLTPADVCQSKELEYLKSKS